MSSHQPNNKLRSIRSFAEMRTGEGEPKTDCEPGVVKFLADLFFLRRQVLNLPVPTC